MQRRREASGVEKRHFTTSVMCNISFLLKTYLKQIQLNIILYNFRPMAACTNSFTLFSAFFCMHKICIGRREGEDKCKRKNRKEEERTKKR